MKVLIVDDSKAMRIIVRRGLRQAGFDFEVSEAVSGLDALNSINAATPDLVLCDWNMPEMTGIELLEKLGESGSVSIPFGFITSESTDEMKNRAMAAGALFLLTKPFTPDTLKATLQPHV